MCRVPFSLFVFVGFEKNEKKRNCLATWLFTLIWKDLNLRYIAFIENVYSMAPGGRYSIKWPTRGEAAPERGIFLGKGRDFIS